MKGKAPEDKFRGYTRDKFEVFRKQKEELFHQKHGRFANKNVSLTNSRESIMIEPGSMFAMDNLFEECREKLCSLSSMSKLSLI